MKLSKHFIFPEKHALVIHFYNKQQFEFYTKDIKRCKDEFLLAMIDESLIFINNYSIGNMIEIIFNNKFKQRFCS